MRGRLLILCFMAVLALSLTVVPAALARPMINVSVSGVVLNASTGLGIPFAHVSVAPDGIPGTVAEVTADYQGKYSLTLPAGVYLFSYSIPGSFYYLDQVTLAPEPTAKVSYTIDGYETQRVYRFFNMKAGTHFYTASDAEFMNVYGTMSSIFKYDGVAYFVEVNPQAPSKPLYRFYNKKRSVHLYIADEAEKANVLAKYSSIYTYEGVAYNVRADGLGVPVYRFYLPSRNTHFYTTATSEITGSRKLSSQYHYEGIAYYVGALRD